jgi:hypothetical protein
MGRQKTPSGGVTQLSHSEPIKKDQYIGGRVGYLSGETVVEGFAVF